MPKFTVTVEIRQLIEIEGVEAPTANDLYCQAWHKDLSPETQNKLNNPLEYGKITSTDIEVEEVTMNPINLGEEDYEFDYQFETFNNNQILELHPKEDNLIILFSDGAKLVMSDDQDCCEILNVFNHDSLPENVRQFHHKLLETHLPF